MITLKVLTNETELSDGLSLNQARVYVFRNGGSVSYVPLEPNPLGHKARLVVANVVDGVIEIDKPTYSYRKKCVERFFVHNSELSTIQKMIETQPLRKK